MNLNTEPITRKLTVSSNWSDTSKVCYGLPGSETQEETSSAFWTRRDLDDDRNIMACCAVPSIEMGIAEALTTTIGRPSAMSTLAASIPYSNERAHITHTVHVQDYLQTIRDLQIESLAVLYKFLKADEIRAFLKKNMPVVSSLFDVYEQIDKIFRGYVSSLKIDYQIDAEEQFEGLTVLAETPLPPEPALELLEKFDDEWWLDRPFSLRKMISVMTRSI